MRYELADNEWVRCCAFVVYAGYHSELSDVGLDRAVTRQPLTAYRPF